MHPVVLLQVLLPHLFGSPAAPAEAWWGGRFFSKGLPYFLSLYAGPLALGLAALGLARLRRGVGADDRGLLGARAVVRARRARRARVAGAGAAARVVVSLPEQGAAAALPRPRRSPWASAWRGCARTRVRSRAWRRSPAGRRACGLVVVIALALAPAGLVSWTGVRPAFWPALRAVAARDAASCGLLAAGTVAARLRGATRAAAIRARGGAGRRAARGGPGARGRRDQPAGRSRPSSSCCRSWRRCRCGIPTGAASSRTAWTTAPRSDRSLTKGGPELTLGAFFISRQMLVPYTNVLDRLESPEGKDLTAFAPRARELDPGAVRSGAGRAPAALAAQRGGVARAERRSAGGIRDLTLLGAVEHGGAGDRRPRLSARAAVAAVVPGVPGPGRAGRGAVAAAAVRAGLRPPQRRGAGGGVRGDLQTGRGVGSGQPSGSGAVRDEGGRRRLSRGARELRTRLAGARRRQAGAGAAGERQAHGGSGSRRDATTSSCATSRPACARASLLCGCSVLACLALLGLARDAGEAR